MKLHVLGITISMIAAIGVFVSCAPITFLNTITPSGSYTLAKNVSYGDDKRQALDIYQADKPRANAPTLVFIHGGSWSDGNKNMYKFIGEAFASEGYTIAIPNYRLYPQVKYPAFVNDTAAAVAFIAKRYADRPILLMGHSAGAYNAMMITVDPTFLKAQGVDVCKTIVATIGMSGPYGAFPLVDDPYPIIFPDLHQGTDGPVHIIKGPTPPVFLPIGDKDTTVSPKHGRVLAERITARGGKAEFKLYPGLNHTDVAKVMSRYFDDDSTLKADMLAFIEAHSITGDNFCR